MLKLVPVPGKEKSRLLCKAFAAGAPAGARGTVFFGTEGVMDLWQQARRNVASEPFFYLDNSYFDRCRGTYFRVTKNALQVDPTGKASDGSRFAKLGINVRPWRKQIGTELLLCPQSDLFMKTVFGRPFDWAADVLQRLDFMGNPHPVRVRPWNRDKPAVAVKLLADLPNIRTLITHSSASAITAMLEGVPAISEAGAAHTLTGPLTHASLIDPPRPDGRLEFAQILADHQFTLDEFRDGTAWRRLNP
ncbi:MAG: hypothetical protein KF863_21510 [Rubrivivax sp.]|nr:hypothetical protein [Rubrivivax sp.]